MYNRDKSAGWEHPNDRMDVVGHYTPREEAISLLVETLERVGNHLSN
jgi:hypothetical protein